MMYPVLLHKNAGSAKVKSVSLQSTRNNQSTLYSAPVKKSVFFFFLDSGKYHYFTSYLLYFKQPKEACH